MNSMRFWRVWMSEGHKIKIGNFLFERKGRYKPDDKTVSGLKRVEKIDFQGNFHIGDKPSKTGMIRIRPGDFVISGINVTKGAMGIYSGKEDVAATIHYSSYTFDDKIINVGYFKRFLKSKIFIDLLKEQVKGGIKTEIKPKHLLPLKISLPDRKKQDEIVKQFENIEDDISDISNEITRQQTLLKHLRQSILQDAVSGKLTEEWRKEHPNVEPAADLLKRIKAEKDRLIKEKKIKPQKPLPPITKDEIPFDLPKGWVWCRIGDITYSIVPNRDKPKSFSGNIKWITISNLEENSFTLSEKFEYGLSPEEITKYNCRIMPKGSVLSSCVGRFGIASIIEEEIVANQQLHCFVPIIDTNPLYLTISIIIQKMYFEEAAIQTTLKYVNKTKCESMLVALPPHEEANIIENKVRKYKKLCDRLESQITQSRQHSEMLMQALLKEAFEG